jgi:hypothetical protein
MTKPMTKHKDFYEEARALVERGRNNGLLRRYTPWEEKAINDRIPKYDRKKISSEKVRED